MSTVEMRHEVTTWLETLDEDFLSAVHAMVRTYVSKQKEEPIISYTTAGEAVTAPQFVAEADAAVAAAKQGRSITVEELEKRSEEWLLRSE